MLIRSVHTAEQIPAAALQLKINEIMDAIAFIASTAEYHKSEEAFQAVVDFVMARGSVSSVELAQAFEVNTATVSRWKSGKNAPHPRERPLVIAWLRQKLENDLKSAQEKLISEANGISHSPQPKRKYANAR